MAKKALIVASVASMIDQFIIPNIKLLQSMGYEVDVATNFEKGSTCTDEKIKELKTNLCDMCVDSFQINFDRKITNIKSIIKSTKELNDVVNGKSKTIHGEKLHKFSKYEFIHCHSPIGGVVGRIVAKLNSIKSIYTAHGFHFYKGAPLKNWLLFYPVEWFLSWFTDVLITINGEDFDCGKKKLHSKEVYYVPGVGIDTKKFQLSSTDIKKKRIDLGFNDTDVIILSIGELNDNKNHSIVIKAMGELIKTNLKISKPLHYVIAGKGDLADELLNIAKEKRIESQVHLLGFRTDVPELLQATDIFVLPSKREGLNVSLMEAIVSGKVCIASNIRGNKDLIIDEGIGYLVDSTDLQGWENAITHVLTRNIQSISLKRKEIINMISLENIDKNMKNIYEEIIN